MKPTLINNMLAGRVLAIAAIIGLGGGACRAEDWKIETVDTAGPAYYTSMKADKAGNLHLAYVPEIHRHPLKYAFWDSVVKHWFTMQVTLDASFCTLILDSKEHPRISYADWGTGLGDKLQYATWDGTWKIEPIDVHPGGIIAYYTSIALDRKDNPLLTYYYYADPSSTVTLHLGSVSWTGTYWASMFVDRTGGSGKFNSIAIDSTGRPQIAYANVSYETESLRYAIWNGRTWNREIIEGATGPFAAYSVSMVLDKKDVPHIVYSDLSHRRIKYATRRNAKWETEVVSPYLGAAEGQGYWDRDGIVVDEQGNPYISFFDKGLGQLRVAHRVNGRWIVEVVDGNMSGMTSSLAIAGGRIWVSYAALYERSLKVASRPLDDAAPSVPPPPPPPAPVSVSKR